MWSSEELPRFEKGLTNAAKLLPKLNAFALELAGNDIDRFREMLDRIQRATISLEELELFSHIVFKNVDLSDAIADHKTAQFLTAPKITPTNDSKNPFDMAEKEGEVQNAEGADGDDDHDLAEIDDGGYFQPATTSVSATMTYTVDESSQKIKKMNPIVSKHLGSNFFLFIKNKTSFVHTKDATYCFSSKMFAGFHIETKHRYLKCVSTLNDAEVMRINLEGKGSDCCGYVVPHKRAVIRYESKIHFVSTEKGNKKAGKDIDEINLKDEKRPTMAANKLTPDRLVGAPFLVARDIVIQYSDNNKKFEFTARTGEKTDTTISFSTDISPENISAIRLFHIESSQNCFVVVLSKEGRLGAFFKSDLQPLEQTLKPENNFLDVFYSTHSSTLYVLRWKSLTTLQVFRYTVTEESGIEKQGLPMDLNVDGLGLDKAQSNYAFRFGVIDGQKMYPDRVTYVFFSNETGRMAQVIVDKNKNGVVAQETDNNASRAFFDVAHARIAEVHYAGRNSLMARIITADSQDSALMTSFIEVLLP